MTMTDPIADLLTRIRNGLQAGHESVTVPHSKLRVEVVRILRDEGYLLGYSISEKEPFSEISVVLKYGKDRRPVVRSLQKVSNPGRRVYAGHNEIPEVLGGMGVNILSTSRGVMTGKQARKEGVGGEILCQVY